MPVLHKLYYYALGFQCPAFMYLLRERPIFIDNQVHCRSSPISGARRVFVYCNAAMACLTVFGLDANELFVAYLHSLVICIRDIAAAAIRLTCPFPSKFYYA